MRSLLFVLLLLMPALAFGQGAPMPALPPDFLGSTGAVANGAKLCTLSAGTTTPLATYSNVTLTSALPNPITLSSLGRPTTNGSTETSVYLQAQSYKFILYAAGTGNTCNGTSVGSAIWTRDNIAAYNTYATTFATKMDDKECHTSQQSGATLGARITACQTALASTGGNIITTGDNGSQSITGSVTISKSNVKLICPPPGASNITVTSNPGILISSANNVTIENCKFTLSGASASAVKIAGTVDQLVIDGMVISCDGNLANSQVGIYALNGQTITNPTVRNAVISNCMQGISLTGSGGTLTNAKYYRNLITGAVGTSAGQGYGIVESYGQGADAHDNRIEFSARHDIYMSFARGCKIHNNTSYRHRYGQGVPGSPLVAFPVSRSNGCTVNGNTTIESQDGSFAFDPDEVTPANVDTFIADTNTIVDPTGVNCGFLIGTTNPITNMTVKSFRIANTVIRASGCSNSFFAIKSGIDGDIVGNDIRALAATSTVAVFEMAGSQESGGALYSDRLRFADNRVYGTNSGGSIACFEVGAGVAGGTATIEADSNTCTVPGNAWIEDATNTNPNIWIGGKTPTTGLSKYRRMDTSSAMCTPYAATTNLSASLGSQTLCTIPPGQPGGMYRLTYYIYTAQAASTSSSILITFGWNDGIGNQTKATTALVNGAFQSFDNQGPFSIQVAANSTISFSTTYSSVGATPMTYRIFVNAERM